MASHCIICRAHRFQVQDRRQGATLERTEERRGTARVDRAMSREAREVLAMDLAAVT